MLSVRDAIDRTGIDAPSCLAEDPINSLGVIDDRFDMRASNAVVGGKMATGERKGEDGPPPGGAGKANRCRG